MCFMQEIITIGHYIQANEGVDDIMHMHMPNVCSVTNLVLN